jgi:sRNA-binding carbon storage regulator CsrA
MEGQKNDETNPIVEVELMLLLTRKTNESITCWPHGHREQPLVVRVAEISATGSVTLGFEGNSHEICRTEIFHNFNKENANGSTNATSTEPKA